MEKRYKVGVVGYGWVAGAHIAAINATPQARVTAICSSRALDANELAQRHGGPMQVHKDLRAMLADAEIDVVSICSYPEHHAAQAIQVAEAGKHLILEKPIALNWQDCAAVETAVAQAGVRVCVCFECRFSSQFRTIRAILDQGLLGKVHYGEVDYFHGIGPWYGQYRWNVKKESGGSSLLSAGCHALDALLLCMGHEVEAVSSYSTHSANPDFARYEYPTTSVTIVKFKDGRVGKVASSLDCLQPYYFHVHLVGSAGTLLDNKIYSNRLGGLDKSRWSTLAMKMLDSGDVSDHPYQAQFEAFFHALSQGEEMPLTNLAEALHTHQILFGADRSAALHASPRRH